MQFFHRKRYRFFYPAGLISLVLLPVLAGIYWRANVIFQQPVIIQLRSPSAHDEPSASLRNFTVIEFKADEADNKRKLQLARNSIRKINLQKDLKNGVCFKFSKETKYSILVSTLNICLEERATYLEEEGNIWAYYSQSTPPLIQNSQFYEQFKYFDYGLVNDVIMPPYLPPLKEQILNTWDEFKFQFKTFLTQLNSAKPFWPIAILYLIMLSLTTQKVVKQLRTQ